MAVKRWNGTSWEIYAGSDLAPVKVTDGRVGKTTFIGATTPTGMVDGDIWIDQDTATNAVVPTALLAKGDIFVATGNGAYTRMAAGNSGEQLYVDSSTSTGLRWQGDYNVGKNKVINGDFGIWQRGNTVNISSQNSAYLADRFFAYVDSNAGTFTYSRENFTPGTSAPVAGYQGRYFARIRTGGNCNMAFRTRIEDVRTLAGQTVTFSFWAKASTNKTISYLVRQVYNPNYTYYENSASGSYNVTTSWQRFSFTFTFQSLSGISLTDGNFIDLLPIDYQSVTGNFDIDIWGVQLEAGSVATPFTTNTGNQQAELAACQRYYQRYGNSVPFEAFGVAHGIDANNARMYLPLKVHMRANPGFASSAASTFQKSFGTTSGLTTVSLGASSNHSVSIDFSRTSEFSANGGFIISSVGAGTAYIELSAEL